MKALRSKYSSPSDLRTEKVGALNKLVSGLAKATAEVINDANMMRDERIIGWVMRNIPGSERYEARLRNYLAGSADKD